MRARRALLVIGLAAAAAGPTLGPAAPASATTYRYWSYWHWTGGAWSYSTLGPDSYHVRDKAVEGWRFGRGDASSSTTRPRIGGDYDALCPQQPPAPAGRERVALVVDAGTEPDSPGGYGRRCLTVPTDADSGTQVLRAAGRTLRFGQGGLLCAIDGYPKPPECGEAVADGPAPTATPAPRRSPARRAAARPTPTPRTTPSVLATLVPRRDAQLRPRPQRPSPSPTHPPATHPPTPSPAGAVPSATPSTATPSPSPAYSDLPALGSRPRSGTPWGLLVGVAAVVVLGAAAAARARRR